jgi:hypothetical protein
MSIIINQRKMQFYLKKWSKRDQNSEISYIWKVCGFFFIQFWFLFFLFELNVRWAKEVNKGDFQNLNFVLIFISILMHFVLQNDHSYGLLMNQENKK